MDNRFGKFALDEKPENFNDCLSLFSRPASFKICGSLEPYQPFTGVGRAARPATSRKVFSWIAQGTKDLRATGAVLGMPFFLAREAEALHLASRTSEALEAISESESLAERFEQRVGFSLLHRLRGVFLTDMGADEMQIEASFCAAIRIAKEQKSVPLEKRAEATCAEYRRQKASATQGRGFRLPLW